MMKSNAWLEKQKKMQKQIRNVKKKLKLSNEADQFVFTTEKTLKDLEGKMDEEK